MTEERVKVKTSANITVYLYGLSVGRSAERCSVPPVKCNNCCCDSESTFIIPVRDLARNAPRHSCLTPSAACMPPDAAAVLVPSAAAAPAAAPAAAGSESAAACVRSSSALSRAA